MRGPGLQGRLVGGRGQHGPPVEGPAGAKALRQGWGSACRSCCRSWGWHAGWPEEPEALPHLQEEMLYEEALYTVLHRAGTLGPDQVDDQEALLGYLQLVSPAQLWDHCPPPPLPAGLPGSDHTHRLAPCTHMPRLTGMPRDGMMDRHVQQVERRRVDGCPQDGRMDTPLHLACVLPLPMRS